MVAPIMYDVAYWGELSSCHKIRKKQLRKRRKVSTRRKSQQKEQLKEKRCIFEARDRQSVVVWRLFDKYDLDSKTKTMTQQELDEAESSSRKWTIKAVYLLSRGRSTGREALEQLTEKETQKSFRFLARHGGCGERRNYSDSERQKHFEEITEMVKQNDRC